MHQYSFLGLSGPKGDRGRDGIIGQKGEHGAKVSSIITCIHLLCINISLI